MKLRLFLFLSFLFGGILLSPAGVGYAQEETPSGPVYIVQQGDTLTTIAIRFGVTVNDLLSVNRLGSNDLIFVGDAIIIPGLDGVTGVLETRTVPYGETLRSLSRRYQIPVDKLVKLNRLVSPQELFAGSALILPVSPGGVLEPGRSALASGQSFLELAVLENINPWTLSGFNELPGLSRAVLGDVMLNPVKTSAGPGAFPATVSEVQISEFYQGETAVIHIRAESGIAFQGNLIGHEFSFYPVDDGDYAGLQGIHALTESGLYPFTVFGTLPDGGSFAHSQLVLVRPRGYLFETIIVPPELIDPEITNKEEAFVRPLVTRATPERYWQGLFVSPSPCPTCINSSFGNRRSYNGSAFTYFHGGVDFPPVSLEVRASADGIVLFADFLEVRGNFTLIDHGWGVFTAYLHQSEISVQSGDRVQAGQVIGSIGNTGRSTGAHLHWEVWVGGVQVNPLDWLDTPYP